MRLLIGERKARKEKRTLERFAGGSLQEKDLNFGFIGEASRGEAWFFTGEVYQNDEYPVNTILSRCSW